MSQGHPIRAHSAIPRFIACLCAGGMAVGVALCLLQGQGAKADRYAAAAQAYYAQSMADDLSVDSVSYLRGAARQAALQSLSHDPGRAQSWAMLSEILLQSQSFAAAAETGKVAQNMGFQPDKVSSGFAAVSNPAAPVVRERP